MIAARTRERWQAERVKRDRSGPVQHDLLPELMLERPVFVWEDFNGFTVEVGRERVVSFDG